MSQIAGDFSLLMLSFDTEDNKESKNELEMLTSIFYKTAFIHVPNKKIEVGVKF